MAFNESLSLLVNQAVEELSVAQISFGFKIMIVFGFFYLLNTSFKTGGSIIEMIIYVIAFIKWIIFKIIKKDI